MNTPEIVALWKAVDDLNSTAYEVPALSFEEYQKRLGEYQGLRKAIQIVGNLQDIDDDVKTF